MTNLSIEVGLRKKNQLTLPEAVVERLGAEPGDRLIFEVGDEPDRVSVRLVRRSYYGMLAGVFGTEEDVMSYLNDERSSWDE